MSYRITYIISIIDKHSIFRVEDENCHIEDRDINWVIKNIDNITNAKLLAVEESGYKIEYDTKRIYVKDLSRLGGLRPGLNDFLTFCKMGRSDLLAEYDQYKNAKKPNEIAAKALDKVWWKCSKCGHEWETNIKSRTQLNSGCPHCKFQEGKYHKVFTGENDLYTWCIKNNRMDLLDELMDPIDVHNVAAKEPNISRKWKCLKCGNVFSTSLGNRTDKGTGCPHCASNGNSYPEYIIYHYMLYYGYDCRHRTKIDGMEIDIYIPELKVAIDYRGVYWHSLKDRVATDIEKETRLNKLGYKTLVIEDQHTKNIIKDNTIYFDGHSYTELINLIIEWLNNTNNMALKFDNEIFGRAELQSKYLINSRKVLNSVIETDPDIIKTWDFERNGTFKPDMVTRGSKYKAWFKCKKCGQSYYSSIRKQVNGQGCPVCSGNKVVTGYNDLAHVFEGALKEWCYEENNKLGIVPTQVSVSSNKRVWWKCTECGNMVFQTINQRVVYEQGVYRLRRCMNCKNNSKIARGSNS